MNRREFVSGSIAAVTLTGTAFRPLALAEMPRPRTIRITAHPEQRLGAISPDFMGLGYEISSVVVPGLLSARNRVYVQLVRTLGTQGVIRVGGNTSDYSRYSPQGSSVSKSKASVINNANLQDLNSFLDAIGWKLILGLNLGNGTVQNAVDEAKAVMNFAGSHLLAFQIGNEPDLYIHEGHRHAPYTYENYLSEYCRYKQAIRAVLPDAPFAGPDVAFRTDWFTRFAVDEGHDLRLLTHHYYRGGAGDPSSTAAKLLQADSGLTTTLKTLRTAASAAHLPYRICETNSFSGGGRRDVSDTFAEALWVLDYMHLLATAGASGVNIETGVNQLDVISSYSPIEDDLHGCYTAAPAYYGMLAFAQGSRGQRVALDYDAGAVNLNAYAVSAGPDQLSITLINKDLTRSAEIEINASSRATAMRLSALSLASKDGITLGSSAVNETGGWIAEHQGALPVRGGFVKFALPMASAAIVSIGDR